eukprot:m.357042 g.357042  ORF g.357042 m.357042 type:complete len:2607 (+) comp17695_c0_seq1:174-7994(+)
MADSGDLFETTPLRFGDSVSFYDAFAGGYIFSSLSGTPFSALHVERAGSLDDPEVGNFQCCVFQILAQNKHRASKARRAAFRAIQDEARAKGKTITEEEAMLNKPKFHELVQLDLAEQRDNEQEQARRKGDPVTYGQVVQLLHAASNSFVRVSGTMTTPSEPNNMQIELSAVTTRSSLFKIMPRYKVRSEGDQILMGDQIVLESIKTSGQFFHTTSHPRPERELILPNTFDVNISVLPTAYTIRLFKHSPEYQTDDQLGKIPRYVRGGDFIQLFHKEVSGFLAAEGSFLNSSPYEDVHIRIREPDPRRPHRQLPPTSSISFWQVEVDQSASNGSIVEWNSKIRLKHVCTQMYLTLVPTVAPEEVADGFGEGEDYNMRLTSDGTDPDTVFTLHAVIPEGVEVLTSSYARLCHCGTGYWLHADRDKTYTRSWSHPVSASTPKGRLADEAKAIVWDQAPLIDVTCTRQRRFDDAFIVHAVPPRYASYAAYVSGFIPVLQKFIDMQLSESDMSQMGLRTVSKAMLELRNFLQHATERRQRQKLLRTFDVVGYIVHALQAPFKPYNPNAKFTLDELKNPHGPIAQALKAVMISMYTVLEACLNGDSRKNELYTAVHIPFFLTQLGYGLGMESMLTELIRDNQKLVDLITEEEMAQIVKLLQTDKNPDYLELLSVLCSIEGVAIGENQEKVCRLLLDSTSKPMVYLTRVEDSRLLVNVSGAQGQWLSLSDITSAARRPNADEASKRRYRFLIMQLDLFNALCLQRCQPAIDIITVTKKYLTWDECFTCARDPDLPLDVRRKYVDLMINLFIDVGENIDILAETELAFEWDSLSARPIPETEPNTSLSKATLPFFADLSAWITKFLEGYYHLYANQIAQNEMLLSVLQLTHALVEFGYYNNPHEISALVKLLLPILSGMLDRPKDNDRKGTLSYAPKKKVKRDAAAPSTAMVEQWLRTTRFERSQPNKVIVECKEVILEILDTFANLSTTVRLKQLAYDFKQVGFTGDRRQTRTSKAGQVFHFSDLQDGPTLTVDMLRMLTELHGTKYDEKAEDYPHTRLVRQYTAELFDRSNYMLPAWRPALSVSREFKRDDPQKNLDPVEILMDLAKYRFPKLTCKSLQLLNRFFSTTEDMFTQAVKAQLLVHDDSKQLLAYLKESMPVLRRLGAGQIEEGSEAEEFTGILDRLTAACELDRYHPHELNQQMIVNSGLLSVLFDVLNVENQTTPVLESVFTCLRALAKGNEYVQNEFFERLDNILTVETDCHGWEDELAGAVAEVFANNQELSLKLSQHQVELMMNVVEAQTIRVPQLVDTVRSIVKCEELEVPLPRNQNLVMKHLMRSFADVVEVAFIDVGGDKETSDKRMELLRYRGSDPDRLNLQRYHANLVSLFAQCAEGYDRFIESTCSTLFTLEELLEVIGEQDIPLFVRSAYMRFLNFVYIETTANPLEVGTVILQHDSRLWHYLKRMALINIKDIYSRVTPVKPFLSLDEDTFVYDAYLPLLDQVLTHFYNPEQSACHQPVQEIAQSLCAFAHVAVRHIYETEQLKQLSFALASLQRRNPSFVPGDLLTHIYDAIRRPIQHTPMYEDYQRQYNKQLRLNDEFNNFVLNIQKQYQGKNEVRVQLPNVSAPPEILDRDYCESVEEDESLPLGPEFQLFVQLFLKKGKQGHMVVRSDNIRSLVASLEASHRYHGVLVARDQELQEVLDIKTLQTLRAMIHNEIKLERDYEFRQNELAKLRVVLPVADLLSNNNDDVVQEALALLVALLRGGNDNAQDTFITHFLGTREETFFSDIQSRIRRSIESSAEIRELKRQLAAAKGKEADVLGTLTLSSQQLQAGPLHSQIETVMQEEEEEKEDVFGQEDAGNIELVLRVLQYMCEGHRRDLQDYLRRQPDNIRSIDLVSETVRVLIAMMDEISPQTIERLTQTVETLVEFAQGCQPNQQSIFDARAVDSINYMMRLPDFARSISVVGRNGNDSDDDGDGVDGDVDEPVMDPQKVARLFLGIGNLLLSMMENNDEPTELMAKELEETLDRPFFYDMLIRFMHVAKNGADEDWETDEDVDDDPVHAQAVVHAFTQVLIRLSEFTKRNYIDELLERIETFVYPVYKDSDPVEEEDVEDLQKMLSSIEIQYEGQVHRVYFFNHWKNEIRDDVKEETKWNIERGAPAERYEDFLGRAKTIVADIKYQRSIKQSSPFANALLDWSDVWGYGLLIVTMILNILVLADWTADVSYLNRIPITSPWYDSALLAFGAIHLFLSLLVTSSYFVLKPPSLHATLMSLPFGSRLIDKYNIEEPSGTRESPFSISSIYHLCLVLFSILGIFYYGYFYCFHLLHVIVGNDILLRVIKAVTLNGISLLWVAALMVIVIYIYSLVSFAFLRRNFNVEDGAFCQTEFQCFVTSLRLGLMSGGGLGEALPAFTESPSEPGWRTFFDLSYFIIVTIIGLNVVFGIIVDTFSELRDDKFQKRELMEGQCFICGIDANDFERHADGFGTHYHEEHNMWDYVAFFLHLDAKEETEYTAHEQYVQELFEVDNYTFLPSNKALSLCHIDDSGVENKLADLEDKVERIVRFMEKDMMQRAQAEKERDLEAYRRHRETLQRAESIQAAAPADGDDNE